MVCSPRSQPGPDIYSNEGFSEDIQGQPHRKVQARHSEGKNMLRLHVSFWPIRINFPLWKTGAGTAG